MAMESQGIRISRASSSPSTLTTTLAVEATIIKWPDAAADFAAAGFTTDMYLQLSNSTELHPVKAVATTSISIHGSWLTTGSDTAELTGWGMDLVGEVTNFSGPGGQAAVIDITSFDSTAKEKLIGIRDEGELNLTVNYNATNTGQNRLKDDRATRTRGLYTVRFNDITTGSSAFPSWCFFNGYCNGFSVSGAVDDKVSANAVIIIDGPVIFSTKTTGA